MPRAKPSQKPSPPPQKKRGGVGGGVQGPSSKRKRGRQQAGGKRSPTRNQGNPGQALAGELRRIGATEEAALGAEGLLERKPFLPGRPRGPILELGSFPSRQTAAAALQQAARPDKPRAGRRACQIAALPGREGSPSEALSLSRGLPDFKAARIRGSPPPRSKNVAHIKRNISGKAEISKGDVARAGRQREPEAALCGAFALIRVFQDPRAEGLEPISLPPPPADTGVLVASSFPGVVFTAGSGDSPGGKRLPPRSLPAAYEPEMCLTVFQ